MKEGDNPNWFANSPLSRVNIEKDQHAFVEARLADQTSLLLPMWRGDPLMKDGAPAFLNIAALSEFPKDAPLILLGLIGERAYFAVDISSTADSAETAPFTELGGYMPLRNAAGVLSRDDLAVVGQARWFFEWRRKHRFCANCGAETEFDPGGAKARCLKCEAEHFPRLNPVSIVLAVNEDACLLGRGHQFPPGFVSALAGFVEAGETPEECARRELFEEAGVTIDNVRYLFSQPWPFTCALMMGFHAEAQDRALTVDTDELAEAGWYDRKDVEAVLNGEERGFVLPPPFTIARQLIERWVKD
ncbi:NAD(+) diphosphatase [Hyphococcus luteus]|uniref:NAD(+) diphosphatase n=1 Tax=Hyphococcus luteus TaxID=2058213 RepID=A0A2S7K6K8_9PROT|nr:NAD(+) diphosphatase [Marinicaulis flavus]PQA88137.1 NAD(+) diphosphatase [Marinicaulis flavus]